MLFYYLLAMGNPSFPPHPHQHIPFFKRGALTPILSDKRLWDVFTNQEAVEFVQAAMAVHSKPELVARKLVEEAIKKGSMDNITICLVFL